MAAPRKPAAAAPAARPAPSPHKSSIGRSAMSREPLTASWKAPAPIAELPRQPSPAAHPPVRKPPKPRAPKPKAISHEQAVANLQALLEAKKCREREGPSWPAPNPHTGHHDESASESGHAQQGPQVSQEAVYGHTSTHNRGN